MSHSPQGPRSLLIKPSGWARQALAAIPLTGQFGSKAHERAEGVLSHSQEEASSTNPASQSQTSHIKTQRSKPHTLRSVDQDSELLATLKALSGFDAT
ncbi:hypothetical protein AHiyo8_02850 [Arthrobacter sp. Hiyo8]|nr:hypothetical protein AHiyo8_02850 [Arthrobacter sp. Hiyo8]